MKQSNAKGFGAKGWVILILTFFSILMNSMIIYDSLNVTLLPDTGLGWPAKLGLQNPSILYVFSTIAAWISVPGAIFFGWLCGKKSCKFSWGLALVINAAACALWSFANSSPIYLIFLCVANICGMGFSYIASLNVVSNWYPTKKGLAMGVVTIGFPLSATIATPLCSGLLFGVGLNGIYYMFAAVCLILGVLVFALVKDYPEQSGAYPDNDRSFDRALSDKLLAEGLEYRKTSVWQPKKFLRTGNVWKIIFPLGVMELFSLGVMSNFVPRMAQIGFDTAACTPMLACAGLVACVGSYLCGVMDQKLGTKKAIIITFIFGIVSLALNIIGGFITTSRVGDLGYILIFIGQPFMGIMLGGAANYLVSLISTIWGRYDFDNGYRVMKPIVAIIGALGITICGALGNAPGVGYAYAYMLICALCVIAVIIATRIDDTYVGKKD
mgnify:CR=1 FL=1